jgi:elongation factor Ts
MAGVDMWLLKELRAATNAPLKDCKQALEDSGNDYAAAQEWLKEKGILKAASKADRVTKEWVVVVRTFWNKTVGTKLACETDFVAKNEVFWWLAVNVLEIASKSGPVASIAELDSGIKNEIDEMLQSNFVAIGENMQVADLFVREWTSVSYVHPGNKLVAVVFYDGDEQKAKAAAMQIAAMNPTYLQRWRYSCWSTWWSKSSPYWRSCCIWKTSWYSWKDCCMKISKRMEWNSIAWTSIDLRWNKES